MVDVWHQFSGDIAPITATQMEKTTEHGNWGFHQGLRQLVAPSYCDLNGNYGVYE